MGHRAAMSSLHYILKMKMCCSSPSDGFLLCLHCHSFWARWFWAFCFPLPSGVCLKASQIRFCSILFKFSTWPRHLKRLNVWISLVMFRLTCVLVQLMVEDFVWPTDVACFLRVSVTSILDRCCHSVWIAYLGFHRPQLSLLLLPGCQRRPSCLSWHSPYLPVFVYVEFLGVIKTWCLVVLPSIVSSPHWDMVAIQS